MEYNQLHQTYKQGKFSGQLYTTGSQSPPQITLHNPILRQGSTDRTTGMHHYLLKNEI